MNKNLRVISSVALAGMLALNAHSPKALAATNDKFVGTYNGMAQIVLADASEQATLRDISSKFNITGWSDGPLNDETPLKTGQTFTTSDNKTYKVVVYGDVNGDGKVTPADAAAILQSYTGEPLHDEKAEAANVARSTTNHLNNINPADAANILKFYTGGQLIDGELQHDKEEEVSYDYNLSVVGNGYINNTNQNQVEVNIKLAKELTKKLDNCKFVTYETGKKGTSDITSAAFSIPAYTSQFVPTIKINTASIAATTVETAKTVVIELQDAKGNVLGKTTTTKNTVMPQAINVRTERENTLEANLSFESYQGNEISKVYYMISSTVPSTPLTITKQNVIDNEKTITVTNNKLEKVSLEGLTNNDKHQDRYVYYILEDKFGNQSAVLSTKIFKEEAKKQDTVSKIEVPDLTVNANFTLKNSKNLAVTEFYYATIYKDEKIIGIVDNTDNGTRSKNSIINMANIINTNGAGTYKVSAIIKGNGTTIADSDPIESETVTVAPLPKVSDAKIEKVGNNLKVSWVNPSETKNIRIYSVDIYKYDETTKNWVKDNTLSVNTSNNSTNNITTANSITTKDTLYYAKVKSMPIANNYEYSFEEEESNKIFVENTRPTIVNNVTTTSNSATVNINNIKKLDGFVANCKLRVLEVTGESGNEEERYRWVKDVENITVDANRLTGNVVVKDLQPNTRYIFQFVEKIGDVEITSDYAPNKGQSLEGILTKQELQSITGLEVSKDYAVDSTVEGKICVSGNNIAINGTIYDTTDSSYPQELTDAKSLVSVLQAGDIITINNNNVILELASNMNQRTLPAELANKDVTIKCDTVVAKQLSATAGSLPKSVTLSGNSAIYTINNTFVDIKDVIVEKGVRAVNADSTQELKLNVGANVTVNDVQVSTENEETIIKVNTTNKEVVVETNESSNVLRFTNNGNINFIAKGTSNKEVQSGEIYINTDKAVTISAAYGVAVDSTINVISAAKVTSEVAKTINLTNSGLNGTKTVTVNEDAKSTVVFYSKTEAPKKSDGTQLTTTANNTVTLRQNYISDEADYLQELEIAGLISAKDLNGQYNQEEVTTVTNYLKSFGIDDVNAKLKLEANNKVTITFANGATKTVTIGNIK